MSPKSQVNADSKHSAGHKRSHPGPTARSKYRPRDGVGWTKRTIDGPGIWATCVKGKEKQAVGELYDLFDTLASDMWPLGISSNDSEGGNSDEELSIEAQIAKEVAAMKRPKIESRFSNCMTGTPCVIFIACKEPVDPVRLVVSHVENVQRTGISRTRYTHRLVPSAGACAANLPDIDDLCAKIFKSFFEENPGTWSYKVELRIRNHNTHSRDVLIQRIVRCLPEGHKVDLNNPEIFILAEVFKSVCGISVVKDYYRLQKFNIMEVGKDKSIATNFDGGEGRVSSGQATSRGDRTLPDPVAST
ncbi:hypothetical protein PLEOSDRAFT_174572 [Pleurotus ostreatus PC15]|uniref:THUMP domain-containing protein n=1 Tax=Pleurotus ostreatus (strain PC15) TaxID=1137138 RepID=A0A067N8M4_PLEO1|nr:hypothetical protein PLEOSDRAFT_174572 [Pleurotus ostreatus PC15]